MQKCLMLASTDLAKMPSEAQEIVNHLNGHGYQVQLLQSEVTSLELYRALQEGPFALVWIASHSEANGFSFEGNVISPVELGQFLQEAQARDLVLNNCFSIEHVNTIQDIANVNIIATLAAVEDSKAWTSALYLAKSLTRTGNLQAAYRVMLSSGNSLYRWFPALKVAKVEAVVEETRVERTDRIARLEHSIEQVMRVISGDEFSHATGLLSAVDDLRKSINTHVQSDEQWKRETEIRIRVLEANAPANTLVLTRQTVRLLLISFIVATSLIILMAYLLSR